MLALAAFVIFVIAAIVAFFHVWTVMGVLCLFAVAFACLAIHGFAIGGAYTWRRP
jgi:hypothetical protein